MIPNHEARVIMLNECEQLWASRAAQALDARLTNHVVAPSVNPALESSVGDLKFHQMIALRMKSSFKSPI